VSHGDASRYRPWAELLKRCFSIDVLTCTGCGGRMRLVALVTEPASIRRLLRGVRETSDAPPRAGSRPALLEESRAEARCRRDAGRVAGREETKDGAKDADGVTADVCATEPASCDEARSRARRIELDDGSEAAPHVVRDRTPFPGARRTGGSAKRSLVSLTPGASCPDRGRYALLSPMGRA